MAGPQPTDAERALAALFEARAAHFTEKPLDVARATAFERFAANGLPHRRVEAYKYTDLKARLRKLPEPAGEASVADVEALLESAPPLPGVEGRIVVANGRYMPQLSSVRGLEVFDILDPAADVSAVGALVADSDDALTLANIGLFDGGVAITVDAEAPRIEILHIATADALVMGRVAIQVGRNATARFVERTIGAPGAVFNNLAELTVADDGAAEMVRVAHGVSDRATHLSSLHMRLGARAVADHLTLSTGDGLLRGQVFCHVAGDEAQAHFRTATVSLGRRHADNTLVVRHDALHSSSTEEFRSAVGAGGASIVQGRIIVDPGAQKTDAKMMSRALYLDDEGEVVNKPELEIFADDVQCGHGATSGDLDEDMIFYLRARGIPQAQARHLLVEAFLIEALDRLSDEGLQDALADHLRAALAAQIEKGDA